MLSSRMVECAVDGDVEVCDPISCLHAYSLAFVVRDGAGSRARHY